MPNGGQERRRTLAHRYREPDRHCGPSGPWTRSTL